jgi:hypothetical protein
MSISLYHFLRLMADPGINHSLVDARGSRIAAKRMSEHVPTAELFPFTAGERSPKMVMNLVPR